MLVTNSLSLRLFLVLFATIIVTFAVYAIVNIRSTSQQWQQTVYEGALRFSSVIQQSTHYDMLLNRKESVHQVIRTVAQEPGVEGVRIYDKQGVIIFSAASAEIGHRVDLQAEACVSCHTQDVPLQSVPVDSRVRIFDRPGGTRVLGLINPIENAPECYNASCHAHPRQQSVLGVLDVTMSLAETDRRLTTLKEQAVIAAIFMALVAGLFSAAFIYRVVRRPVRQLIEGTQRVAAGELTTRLDIKTQDEIGQLAKAFDNMTRDLQDARQEITEWSDQLEARLEEKTVELSQSQRQVAHMDKMASLGKLAATVAHELNNPLAGILNYAKLVDRTLQEGGDNIPERQDLVRYLNLIQKEANRTGVIVRNLLTFARPAGVEFALYSVNAILERSVMLLRHHLEMADVQLDVQRLSGDDHIVCDADQIQQAVVALLVNAVEAMPSGGTCALSAQSHAECVQITVTDSGVGIPPDVLPRIFEPFYSSKEGGEGSGLGLAVVYGIVRHHGGHIEVDSQVRSGTTIRLVLPRRQDTRATSDSAPVSTVAPLETAGPPGRTGLPH